MERCSRRKANTYGFSAIIFLRNSRASERRRIIIAPQRFIVCLLFKHKYWPRLHVTASPCSALPATRIRTELLSVPPPLRSFNSWLRTLTVVTLNGSKLVSQNHVPRYFFTLPFFSFLCHFSSSRGSSTRVGAARHIVLFLDFLFTPPYIATKPLRLNELEFAPSQKQTKKEIMKLLWL